MAARERQQPMTTTELMKATGLSQPVITRWANAGVLPATQHGSLWFFEPEALGIAQQLCATVVTPARGKRRGDVFQVTPTPPPDFTPLNEAAELIERNPATVRRRVMDGELKGWRVRGRVGVSKSELLAAFDVNDTHAA